MQDNTLYQDNIKSPKAKILIFRALTQTNKPVTQPDLQQATGLAQYTVEDALSLIIKDYPCEFSVNEKGLVVYKFDLSKKRDQKTFYEKLSQILGFAKNLFNFLIKLFITLLFVAYSISVGLIIALIISALSKNLNPILAIFAGLFKVVQLMFKDIRVFFTNELDEELLNSDNLILNLFAFALGNRRKDEYGIDKRILEYISLQNNQITVSDLMIITGWSVQKCKQELSLLFVNYDGNIKVTEKGVIIYRFPDFKKTDKEYKNSDFFVWNNPLETLPYNFNKESVNILLNIVSWLSLVISFIAILIFSAEYEFNLFSFSNLFKILSFNSVEVSRLLLLSSANWLSVFVWFFIYFLFLIISSSLAKYRNIKENLKRKKLNERHTLLHLVFENLPFLKISKLPKHIAENNSDFIYETGGELKIEDETAELFIDYTLIYDDITNTNGKNCDYDFKISEKIKEKWTQTNNQHKFQEQIYQIKTRRRHKLITSLVLLILLSFVYQDIKAVLATNFFPEIENITINYKSPFAKFTKIDNLQNIWHLTIKNATSQNLPKGIPPQIMKNVFELQVINSDFPITFYKNTKLNKLVITNSKLSLIPNRIDTLYKYLSFLDLSHNKIKQIPDSLMNLPISYINLSFNSIDKLPENFFLNCSLDYVDLSHNKIPVLPDTSCSNNNIKLLNLESNKLNEFIPNLNVKILILSNNNFTSIPAKLLDNSPLRVLYFSRNPINNIDEISDYFSEEYFKEHFKKSKIKIILDKKISKELKHQLKSSIGKKHLLFE